MRILLDLDCVLADFVAGAAAAHGLTVQQCLEHWRPGHYEMSAVVGRVLGRADWDEAEFWKPFEGRRAFWADLPVLPWAKELADLVRSLTDDWWVVTSNSLCVECVPGKQVWCCRFFGDYRFRRMVPTYAKHLLANHRTVLIDDCDANLTAFSEAGGMTIGFPAHHNVLWNRSNDPLAHVKEALLCL